METMVPALIACILCALPSRLVLRLAVTDRCRCYSSKMKNLILLLFLRNKFKQKIHFKVFMSPAMNLSSLSSILSSLLSRRYLDGRRSIDPLLKSKWLHHTSPKELISKQAQKGPEPLSTQKTAEITLSGDTILIEPKRINHSKIVVSS